ncbi:hypothetical protein TPHA_0E03550 [Tetrapisispora phaffii CBS 4417]|uniref:Elongation of fatty acids protein n=1 Tax=Tetrapisispora phaffii (strain ATCC 24235 / CBS 4417 / NBRC 1672 / NRRL Y-8282 / UCD 70-5) TaxID=1071381 RepID=G8BU67_TETPH|nr:hypothetical protein TPHA_0E03550 [Tetrapisispora phaffii CBS 4417]CCE63445.1 hypothetical protein TPHA_0E03550 [Tetrapisispora phaffii CBS 4417]
MNSTNVTESGRPIVENTVANVFEAYYPTVDLPFFNISLWNIFNKTMTVLSGGKFVPDEFKFVQGQLPLSELNHVLVGIATYYVVIFGGKFLLRNREPYKLNAIFQLHNIFLTFVSFSLLVLMIEQLFPIIYRNGIFFGICDISAWKPELVTLYYLNYLVKFVEFIDTLFLVLKKKNLTFLHTYHHGATALLCYTQLVGNTSVSWVPITLNLGVHCLMYFYYFLAARGIRVWWKEWVTRFQIVQFIFDVTFIFLVAYHRAAFLYMKSLPHSQCAGSTTAIFSGFCILASYLFLFTAFYIELYKRAGSKKAKEANSKKNR